MERFLDIIIPEYNCKEEFMKRLLHSISRQKNVNFDEIGIIIVNDKSKDKLRKGLFKNFPKLHIEYYLKDVNEGVGMTRQYGLDKSIAKYVTFIDQDDELYGNDTLEYMFSFLKRTNLDYVLTDFIEEVKTSNGKFVELLCKASEGRQTLHGVFIKKEFLEKNNIRMNPFFRVHDDYFMRMCMGIFNGGIIVNRTTYIWKYNETSQVRSKKKYAYMVETFDEYFKLLEIVNEIKNKNNAVNSFTIVDNILSLFIVLESNLFDAEELSSKKVLYEEKLYEMICKYNKEIEISRRDIDSLFKEQFELQKKSYPDIVLNNYETIFDFINAMGKKYPNYIYEKINSKKLLDVIIPYYNIDQNCIERIMNSIVGQKNISIREICVTLVSDNSPTIIDFDALKKKYPMVDINHYQKDINEGPGLTRQYGLDRSDANYVTFLDSDDLFYGPVALQYIFAEIRSGKYDIIFSNYFRYDPTTNNKRIITPNEMMCLHGVFFKRQSLVDGNYRFSSKIRQYEDTYFMQITNNSLSSTYIDLPTYIWMINPNSITAVENVGLQMIQRETQDFIDANFDSIDFLNDKNKLNGEFLVYKLYEVFATIESELFDNYSIENYEKQIYEFYLKYIDVFNRVPADRKKIIYEQAIDAIAKLYSASIIKKKFEEFVCEKQQ